MTHAISINRRDFVQGIGAAGALASFGTARALAKGGQPLPNIIFIMADDLGYADLGVTGSRHIKTPHIDSIAENGVMLTNSYANSCVCSPTRVALLTGCYQQRFAIGLEEPINPLTPKGSGVPFERRTIAETLKRQGYQTALVGKWHLGDPPKHGPMAHGYEHFLGIVPGGVDYFRHRAVIDGRNVGAGLMRNNEEINRTGYLTDLLGEEAVRVIREKRAPLFLSLHFTAPHWPWEGREDEEVARQLKDFFHYDGGTLETYANMVSAMDDNVGKVLAALRAAGELESSIIVFTSDNGGDRFSDTWPFTGVKGELLEGGIRVPILAQWPGRIPAGSTSDQLMMSMDFLPTLLGIVGGEMRANEFDGMDLSAQIMGEVPLVERTLFWRFKSSEQAAVRQGPWKYLKLGDQEHLFNVEIDPRERAQRKEAEPRKFEELRSRYDAWNTEMLPYPIGSFSADIRENYADRY